MPKNGMDGRQEAGCYQFLEFLRSKNSERRKNGMDAVALGRHGCRLVPIPGVFVKQKPHAQK
jgi:hypothetical protein